MLLRFQLLFSFLIASSLCLGDSAQPAETGEKGHGSVDFRLGFYYNGDDGDGNPFLDEELLVIEPVVVFDYNISDDKTVWGKFSSDYVSSASIDRLNKFPQQSGASGDYYFGLDLGLKQELSEDSRAGVFATGSVEYDYLSFGLGGDYAKDLPDYGATIKWSVNGYVDSIDIIRYDGAQDEGSDTRTTISSSLNWYQVMTPTLHGEMGATLTQQNGFLETAYNAVVIEDGSPANPNLDNQAAGREITEELPEDRTRGAVFGKIRKFYKPDWAIELGGRLYGDSWGITSLTIEPRVYYWLIPEKLNTRLRYRFYTQTEADDYREHFTEETEFRTQDSDLAEYTANSFGIQFNLFQSEYTTYDISLDYVLRSDGLDQVLAGVGVKRRF